MTETEEAWSPLFIAVLFIGPPFLASPPTTNSPPKDRARKGEKPEERKMKNSKKNTQSVRGMRREISLWSFLVRAYHSEWIQLMFIPMDSPQWIHILLMNVLHAYLSLYMRSSFLIPWISLECHTWCQCFESQIPIKRSFEISLFTKRKKQWTGS